MNNSDTHEDFPVSDENTARNSWESEVALKEQTSDGTGMPHLDGIQAEVKQRAFPYHTGRFRPVADGAELEPYWFMTGHENMAWGPVNEHMLMQPRIYWDKLGFEFIEPILQDSPAISGEGHASTEGAWPPDFTEMGYEFAQFCEEWAEGDDLYAMCGIGCLDRTPFGQTHMRWRIGYCAARGPLYRKIEVPELPPTLSPPIKAAFEAIRTAAVQTNYPYGDPDFHKVIIGELEKIEEGKKP